jgi:hypothetical protein
MTTNNEPGRFNDQDIQALPHARALMLMIERQLDASLHDLVEEVTEREGLSPYYGGDADVPSPSAQAAELYEQYQAVSFRVKRAVLQGLLNRHLRDAD